MGMFDWINFKVPCPVCGIEITGFQSKRARCNLDELEFWQVDNFYSTCEGCGAWIEFSLKDDARKKFTIKDYEMKVMKRGEIPLIKDL